MRKADYRQIADKYDITRSLSEQNLELWINLISKKTGSIGKIDFLDLGCGTGRFSIPIANEHGYSVTGADSSKEMLLKAKEKTGELQIKWDIQDATSLSYSNGSFDAVFMSHLLHHVDEPLQIVKECYRVLRPNGTILNRFAAIEHIRDDPEHRFFPETLEIDEARIPTIKQVEEWFKVVGFNDVSSEMVLQQTYRSAEEVLEKTSLKSTSVLTLISQPSFQQGLNALREYVSTNPNDPWLLRNRITLTTGKKCTTS